MEQMNDSENECWRSSIADTCKVDLYIIPIPPPKFSELRGRCENLYGGALSTAIIGESVDMSQVSVIKSKSISLRDISEITSITLFLIERALIRHALMTGTDVVRDDAIMDGVILTLSLSLCGGFLKDFHEQHSTYCYQCLIHSEI